MSETRVFNIRLSVCLVGCKSPILLVGIWFLFRGLKGKFMSNYSLTPLRCLFFMMNSSNKVKKIFILSRNHCGFYRMIEIEMKKCKATCYSSYLYSLWLRKIILMMFRKVLKTRMIIFKFIRLILIMLSE